MNKYFIGWPAPESLVSALLTAQRIAQRYLMSSTTVIPESEFHITALFLGESTPEHAAGVMRVLTQRPAIHSKLDVVTNFNNNGGPNVLVILIKDQSLQMAAVNNELHMAHGVTKRWKYNPHLQVLAECDVKVIQIPDIVV